MKILTVVGARPQFIKAAVVSRAIKESNRSSSEKIEEFIVHTGQHYDRNMSDIFFDELQIPRPDVNLEIGSLSHGRQTGEMLIRLEELFLQQKPDLILVYGDTNSTLAGSLTAAKLHIPIAHVEAGLRSFNRRMPEEINRIITDQLSELLFCPTGEAVENLCREGIPDEKIGAMVFQSGDVMCDAALYYGKLADDKWLADNRLKRQDYILATIHRAESTDNPAVLTGLIEALKTISNRHLPIVWPVHPRTRKRIAELGMLEKIMEAPDLRMVDPLSYLQMVCAEKNSRLILTDSGGVQKEAYFHGVLCVTMRTETEWVELVESGWNLVAGIEGSEIVKSVETMLSKDIGGLARENFYGDGKAGEKIVAEIKAWGKNRDR